MAMGFLRLLTLASTVVLCVEAFTADQLITTPRRGEAIPNKVGKIAVYSVSEYSLDTHTGKNYWNTLDVSTGKTALLTDSAEVSEMQWVDDSTILYVNGTNADTPGGVELWITNVNSFAKSAYKAASIPGPLINLKIAPTDTGITWLMSGKQTTTGGIYNPETAPKALSSARIYDQIYVRHWDVWLTPETYTLFCGKLDGGAYANYAQKGEIVNLLGGVKGLETPVMPFGGLGDFDITPDGKTVAFLSKDPDLPLANFTASYIYTVPTDGSKEPVAVNHPKSKGTPSFARGASSSPAFSPDGKTLAYLQMDEIDYESDRNKLYLTRLGSGVIRSVAHNWDRSPTGVLFGPDGKKVVLLAEERGRRKVFTLPVTTGVKGAPTAITPEGYVSAVHPMGKSGLMLTNSSFISSNSFTVVDTVSRKLTPLLQANKVDAQLAGLSDEQVEEFTYQGNWTSVQGWLVKPKNFSPEKKYPMGFFIHGGPQYAWTNSWSNRWNLAYWANQGYIIVAINPTGSTGFGERFTDAIQNDWGGVTYFDLVLGFEHIKNNPKTYPYIDCTNAVAAGSSFGGYMVNWIQGNPLGREFKALVTHAGVFSTLNNYETEELWFMQHDFNGTLWDNRANYEKNDPARSDLIKNWATPHLVIHNELDYRLPISQGIALFNILQERGVPSRFISFPDENHFVLKYENLLLWHNEVSKWLNHYSGIGT